MDPILWQSVFLVCPINFWCFFAEFGRMLDGPKQLLSWWENLTGNPEPSANCVQCKVMAFLEFPFIFQMSQQFPIDTQENITINWNQWEYPPLLTRFSISRPKNVMFFPMKLAIFRRHPPTKRPRLWWHRHHEPRWSRLPPLSVWALEVVSRCLQDYIW